MKTVISSVKCGSDFKSLAVIEAKRLPENSLLHYRKARQVLLDEFLPESCPEIQKIKQAIRDEEKLIRRLNEKKCI